MKSIIPATDRQVTYVKSLLSERTITAEQRAACEEEIATGLTGVRASFIIQYLLDQPRAFKAPVAGATSNVYADIDAALADVPASHYAIPADTLRGALTDTNLDTVADLYLQVQAGQGKWKGRKFLKRLHGNPGGFTSSRLSPKDALTVARMLARDSLTAAQHYGDVFAVCAKCHSPLTAEESVSVKLGPTCRKAWGL